MRFTLIIAATILTIIVIFSGIFMINNGKRDARNSERQMKEMQKTIERLESKIEKEDDKDIEVQSESEESEESEEMKVQEPPKIEKQVEENISCVLFDGSVESVTKIECEILKNKDTIRKEIDDAYDECIDEVEDEYEDCLNSNQKRTANSTKIYSENEIIGGITECMEVYDKGSKKCDSRRDEKLYEIK